MIRPYIIPNTPAANGHLPGQQGLAPCPILLLHAGCRRPGGALLQVMEQFRPGTGHAHQERDPNGRV
ncbi:hypothetical protein [Paenibacillus fonticola]|uniref:hypothetical protein n=1 Tax=Paenibacillus fonticola TaxID=379896 RepID=UPI0003A0D947|nr:hypothetical protein [Paenibacillus fonticola]